MALHFEVAEFQQRIGATISMLQERGLDGLLMFRQESMYYLTGYDTFGFAIYLGVNGQLTLFTRAPDLRQAQNTSIIEDIRIWVDRDGATPCDELKSILRDSGCAGRRLGVEYDAYGLNAKNGMALNATLDGFCSLEDASDLVSILRMVKSPGELEYARRAGELADEAWNETLGLTSAGAAESDILAAMQGAVFRGGGDYPGNEFIIGSGADALLCRYFTGRKVLLSEDQLTLEFAGAYRHYHACMMRTIVIGEPTPHQFHMYNSCVEALASCKAALKIGRPIGEVCQRRSKISPPGRSKTSPLDVMRYAVLGGCPGSP